MLSMKSTSCLVSTMVSDKRQLVFRLGVPLGNTCTDVLADLSYNRSMGLTFTKTK